jgi:hypothetical protein
MSSKFRFSSKKPSNEYDEIARETFGLAAAFGLAA